MDFSDLPKIELHLHLDCSLSFEVVQQLNQSIGREQYQESFVAPPKCRDLADYIRHSQSAIALMQTEKALHLVTEDLFSQLSDDNIIYAEIRFAPLEHTQKELSAEDVAQIIDEAVARQISETGIEARVIFCTLRHYSEKQSMKTVKLVDQFKGTNIVGFDIAGDEAGFPIDNHISAFEYANERQISCTAHAGEARGADSVWETINHFRPSRIGHGVRSTEDPELMDYLKEKNIHLEVCPTSNIQTNVYDTMGNHAVDKMYRSDVSMGINTDTRTISDVTLESEYQNLAEQFNWGTEQLLKCNLEAINHAFVDNRIKNRLRQKIIEGFGAKES